MTKKSFAPWSAETAQGIKTDPVDSNIEVKQEIIPAVNVGSVNTKTGEWVGVPTSDEIFSEVTTHINVANTAEVLAPATGQESFIDMTGYQDIFIALKPTNAGNYAIEAVMGPDTYSYGNLTPVNAAAGLKWIWPVDTTGQVSVFQPALLDSAEALTADVWNIFAIVGRLANQKLLQFKVTNGSGGISTIEFAYMRFV